MLLCSGLMGIWVYAFSSPRAKGRGPRGLRAESARAVTGRRCPCNGVGEDFLVRRHFFLTKTDVSRKRRVKKSIRSRGLQTGIDEIKGPLAKHRFSSRNPNCWAQKKRSLLATTGQICAKNKAPFSQINISLLADFDCVFLEEKTDFWPKNRFLTKRKHGRFSVIPAGTRSVVNVGYFLVARKVPPSFVDHGPKLRVLEIGHWTYR